MMYKVWGDLPYSLSAFTRYIEENDIIDMNVCKNMRHVWQYINNTYKQDNESAVQHQCVMSSWEWCDIVCPYKQINTMPFYDALNNQL